LAELIGPDALTATDRSYLLFEDDFAAKLVNQRPDAARPLDETLNRAWEVLARLPRSELAMLPSALLEAHRPDSVQEA
jgi:V/A-type H+-transporting ATPase subunit B